MLPVLATGGEEDVMDSVQQGFKALVLPDAVGVEEGGLGDALGTQEGAWRCAAR